MNNFVTLITTGGTIASVADPSGVRRPVLGAHDLLAATGYQGRVKVREAVRKDSSLLDFADVDQIRRIVAQELDNPSVSGVVVAHGTDTMEETAILLDLLTGGDKPVVLTGAARPASDPATDGPANLRHALAFAASPGARGAGAVICFAGATLAARGAHKRHTGGDDVFGGRAHAKGAPAVKAPACDIAATRVDLVALCQGADRTGVDASVAAGARGLVLATMGNGGVPDSVTQAVAEHARAGIAVVACSRVLGAPVTPEYSGGARLIAAGALLAAELSAPQARMQLAAVLASGSDPRRFPW
ncbi:Asparaginase/glutaminase [Segniliparus rotundus DSM 44985]|uniref:asparaginase n=1 Tax=Segniliparus rotundus (strain ATCC BAA-972 / CDC 1076 / CIP 108378 / DSM 44985 / JCM 13578) TaxID=640132 RepID=D6Z7E4_SEGRD|nr:asparaginase [Segniliparus rotundus]ADG97874.1 Asparaginase/glutaminase [Segniliparus rotundus DSM 44985]